MAWNLTCTKGPLLSPLPTSGRAVYRVRTQKEVSFSLTTNCATDASAKESVSDILRSCTSNCLGWRVVEVIWLLEGDVFGLEGRGHSPGSSQVRICIMGVVAARRVVSNVRWYYGRWRWL